MGHGVMMPAAFSSAIRNVEKYSQGKDSGGEPPLQAVRSVLGTVIQGRLRKGISVHLKFRAG